MKGTKVFFCCFRVTAAVCEPKIWLEAASVPTNKRGCIQKLPVADSYQELKVSVCRADRLLCLGPTSQVTGHGPVSRGTEQRGFTYITTYIASASLDLTISILYAALLDDRGGCRAAAELRAGLQRVAAWRAGGATCATNWQP